MNNIINTFIKKIVLALEINLNKLFLQKDKILLGLILKMKGSKLVMIQERSLSSIKIVKLLKNIEVKPLPRKISGPKRMTNS